MILVLHAQCTTCCHVAEGYWHCCLSSTEGHCQHYGLAIGAIYGRSHRSFHWVLTAHRLLMSSAISDSLLGFNGLPPADAQLAFVQTFACFCRVCIPGAGTSGSLRRLCFPRDAVAGKDDFKNFLFSSWLLLRSPGLAPEAYWTFLMIVHYLANLLCHNVDTEHFP